MNTSIWQQLTELIPSLQHVQTLCVHMCSASNLQLTESRIPYPVVIHIVPQWNENASDIPTGKATVDI